MPQPWCEDDVLALARSYQDACVLNAAADLEIFQTMAGKDRSAADLAAAIEADPRALEILLDALASMQLLQKVEGRYHVSDEVVSLLTPNGENSVLAMVQHQANCLRRWAQLATAVKTGKPADTPPSIRGQAADSASFIEAMDNISRGQADRLIGELDLPPYESVLDLGGASGTWSLALLRHRPAARATIVDLPHVIPMAQRRVHAAGMQPHINLVPCDYLNDPLPEGYDLAWVSAIIHMHSREEIRNLFQRVFNSLEPSGRILIRDIVMEDDRTRPAAGAMFAINMLTATADGSTYTFDEIAADLSAAGFVDAAMLRHDPYMNAITTALKPPPGS